MAQGGDSPGGEEGRALVCMYLFLDSSGATVPPHPSPRTASPLRYLECAVVQAASLRLGGADCDLALATNLRPGPGLGLGRAGRRLWGALEDLGVGYIAAPLRIEPGAGPAASRLPREALAAAAPLPDGREVWLPNLDCVWRDPRLALRGAPPAGMLGALVIPYPPDWQVGGEPALGASRAALGASAAELGGPGREPPPWIGADLLAGSAATLRAAFQACDELDRRFAARGLTATNEQLLTLAAALGRVEVADLSGLARRIQTGARHTAGVPAGAAELAIWHLPAEKGLSLRRAARALARGDRARLAGDLAAPPRAMRRFNVGGARRARQLRDDAWVALGRLMPGRGRRAADTLQPTDRPVEGRWD
jgi:hypothetical protein